MQADNCIIQLDEFEVDFDPLAVNDDEIDQDEIDDGNPYDIVDLPTVRNMPETLQRSGLFTPERQGGAKNALEALIDRNPARRDVLLSIIGACADGCPMLHVSKIVKRVQEDNGSVYSALALCRMLESAGGLILEKPNPASNCAKDSQGEAPANQAPADPIWRATPEALEVVKEFESGSQFWDIMDRDSKYREVYKAVLRMVSESPKQVSEISELVDTFDIVHHPRRFGGHFVDLLEKSGAIVWQNSAWTLSDMGRRVLPTFLNS